MESWGTAVVVLAAVLVGVAIPTLVQARATLRAVEQAVLRTGPRLDEAVVTASAAVRRLDGLIVRLEEGGRLEHLVDNLSDATRLLGQARDAIRVASALGAAVGPAVAAAVHAFRQQPEAAPPTPLRSTATDSKDVPPQSAERQATP